ncbi:4Fe-4S dicluster domain protein [Slackia sp. CM382]|uniref:4Fe-4S dicluster domain-containing protein n=1 Tax=Slackia sp. CM382 TaxID=1111137 RepID=UPI00027C4C8A|nr:4Fe-4S dicluster domain-containing protein [Slackia sp. CM382]EJU35323.1 4Fe-4S dicluster domain protein [Slackia sp. CM382]
MKNCLVIDLDRCSGCDSCTAACKHWHNIDLGVYRNRVSTIGPMGTYPDVSMYWLPLQCQQCENPGCIEVCPTGASHRDEETGVVLVDRETCIGCKSCMEGCPYEMRWYNAGNNTVDKCTLCYEDHVAEPDKDWKPACVRNCCTGARLFGDLDDPESDVSKAVAEAGEKSCHQLDDIGNVEPATIYIMRTTAEWQPWKNSDIEVTRYEK